MQILTSDAPSDALLGFAFFPPRIRIMTTYVYFTTVLPKTKNTEPPQNQSIIKKKTVDLLVPHTAEQEKWSWRPKADERKKDSGLPLSLALEVHTANVKKVKAKTAH